MISSKTLQGGEQMKQQDPSISYELINELRSCGHFLHYRMGGRTGRRRVLLILSDHDTLLQRELQEILEVKSGSLSEIIISMEADGLVEKVRSSEDGRQYFLKLSPEGKKQAELSRKEYETQVEKLVSCLSEKQKSDLCRLLKIVLTHWSKLEYSDDFPVEMPDCVDENSQNNE